ncbi:MAG TPA: carboxypeptidase regulatory-like domain-containing protein [Candidatus Poseidoniales archaeon]|nr:carboxypeptidase regulatory-like domain-containing protein [Candidatus Poseidoniales archaeon]HIK78767.1 carboxypeptidase regulatory-like domain-containing protein [Candidatus Poseidoniales archaeon]
MSENNHDMEIDPSQEPIIGLPEEELTFTSSGKKLFLPSDQKVSSSAKILAALLLISALSGFANGIDYTQPEKGIVRPHEWVWSMGMSAPNGTATLSGIITLADGTPAVNHTVVIVMDPSTSSAQYSWLAETSTDTKGYFILENLDPGMVSFEVNASDNVTKGMQHRLLLTPPSAMFEPIGFTYLELAMPSEEEHLAVWEKSGSSYWVDYSEEEMDFPLLDPGAIGTYVMMGFMFIGLAVLAGFFAILAFRSGSVGQIRISAALSFFTVGFYYSACCFALLALALSFALPKRIT